MFILSPLKLILLKILIRRYICLNKIICRLKLVRLILVELRHKFRLFFESLLRNSCVLTTLYAARKRLTSIGVVSWRVVIYWRVIVYLLLVLVVKLVLELVLNDLLLFRLLQILKRLRMKPCFLLQSLAHLIALPNLGLY